ncbi:MAG: glycosyltransferase [Bacteroidaceae bacterium]|nr:glycosyltransferase [Bacteroidaceae bacterium]
MTGLIVVVAAVTIIWVIALLFAISDGRIARRQKRLATAVDDSMKSDSIRFSVVIPAHEQLEALQLHLPSFLEQDYGCFEVIVVDMASTDGTRDYLEQMEMLHPNLRHTAVPATARDISLDRLALTLGIRAARYEWVVMTQASCEPLSSQWLFGMSKAIRSRKETTDIVLGQVQYAAKAHSWTDYKEDYHRLWHTIATANHVMSGHAAVRADGCNVAIRRDAFMAGGGFVSGQTLRIGAADLLVNNLSTPTNTALAVCHEAVMTEERPDDRLWRQMRQSYAAIRSMQRHTTLYRIVQNLRMAQPWMVLLFVVLPLAVSIAVLSDGVRNSWLFDEMENFDVQYGSSYSYYVLIALAVYLGLLMLSYYITRIVNFNRSSKALGIHTFYSSLIIFDFLFPFWQLSTVVGYWFTPRSTYRKKFV